MSKYLLPIGLLFFSILGFAQPILNLDDISDGNGTENWITVKSDLNLDITAILPNNLTETDNTFTLVEETKDKLGLQHHKYQQKYKGYPIFGALLFFHGTTDKVTHLNHSLADLNNSFSIEQSETAALNFLLEEINATTYAWESKEEEDLLKLIEKDPDATYYPKGKIVWIDRTGNGNYYLTYQFEVYALAPLSHKLYFVDVQTGRIIKTIEKLMTCFENHNSEDFNKCSNALSHKATSSFSMADVPATGLCEYVNANNSVTNFTTSSNGGQYILKTENLGQSGSQVIHTLNANNSTSYSTDHLTEFVDQDNYWEEDPVANSVHWGTIQTFEYFDEVHNRNSDNNEGGMLLSRVHYGTNYSNANSGLNYGDGNGTRWSPFTSLEIIGHEFTHRVVGSSAGLIYGGESGALNESFADIFGVTVRFAKHPDGGSWTIGDQIDLIYPSGDNRRGIRHMNNPILKSNPKNYGGQFWEERTGVHSRSGVQNYWFYKLVTGGTGTNEFGVDYSITAITMEEAAAIAYRNLTVYLTPISTYQDARNGSLQATIDLHGENSTQHLAVQQAWCAAGLGNDCRPSYSFVKPSAGEIVPIETNYTIQWASFLLSNTSQVKIEYLNPETDNEWHVIVAATPNTGSYDWLVPNDLGTKVQLRISDLGDLSENRSPNTTVIEISSPFLIQECAANFMVSEPLYTSRAIEASTSISSNATINSGADITFQASQSIELLPGFQVAANAQFSAEIVETDCEVLTCRERDSLILVDLYNATQGNNWTVSWNLADPIDTWQGITLNEIGCVKRIVLSGNNLIGPFPNSFWELGRLEFINLEGNELSGELDKINQLSNLTWVDLYYNNLSGNLPATIDQLSLLQSLDVSSNNLTGSIPKEFGNLSSLRYLYMDDNQLSDVIPPELGDATGLSTLSLYGNNLTGSIPSELGLLINLRRLNLGSNQLTGTIPITLGSFSSLQFLFLNNNQLTGSIPPELGNLSYLTDLNLQFNNLTGSIPSEFGNLVRMRNFYLHNNELSGNIPPELGNLSNIFRFFLNDNNLSGCFPTELHTICSANSYNLSLNPNLPGGGDFNAFCANGAGECVVATCVSQDSLALISLYNAADGSNWTNIWNLNQPISSWYGITTNSLGCVTHLVVPQNQLSGTIPSTIGNLTNLIELDLGWNQLTGSIPSELGNLASLEKIRLAQNNLTGTIPAELGNLSKLKWLSFSFNALSGSIPLGFGSLTELENFALNANQLTGIIPSSLGDLSNLLQLHLNSNQLTGSIPPALGNLTNLSYCYLSNNDLSGCFDTNLSNLCGINYNFFGNANLPGTGDFDAFCTNGIGDCSASPCLLQDSLALVALYTTTNGANWTNTWNLNDPIRNWYGVTVNEDGCVTCLDLDGNPHCSNSSVGNNLNGYIPAALGNLSELTHLYLNNNNLSGGDIPSELGNLAKLERLYIALSQLTGPIPSELGNLPDLKILALSGNQLTGVIPPELGNISTLEHLYFHSNQLTGSIPSELGNLSNLEQLWLRANQLSGSIPSELGNLSKLKQILLSNNQLSGCFPQSLSIHCNTNYNFTSNPNLPGGGDFAAFCGNNTGGCTAINDLNDSASRSTTSYQPLRYSQSLELVIAPNPVVDKTKINYFIPQAGKVKLAVYDIQGQLIQQLEANTFKEKGNYQTDFFVSNITGGIYFIHLETQNGIKVKKMVLLD